LNGLNRVWIIFCENFRTALRTAETFDLVVERSRIATSGQQREDCEALQIPITHYLWVLWLDILSCLRWSTRPMVIKVIDRTKKLRSISINEAAVAEILLDAFQTVILDLTLHKWLYLLNGLSMRFDSR
jgi:hypothetical protein